jgi:iron complex transport system permease protein
VRLPRIITAAIIGAALSTAEPHIRYVQKPHGITGHFRCLNRAGFGAAAAILLGFNYLGITIMSFTFGICAVFLAYAISKASRLNTTLSLVLAGIMVSSLFSAGTSFIKLIADTQDQLPAITYWLMGSLTSIRGGDALFVSGLGIISLIPLFLLRWRINLLTISEDEAKVSG